jgi:L-threonylcarbamoyladenylate synthase
MRRIPYSAAAASCKATVCRRPSRQDDRPLPRSGAAPGRTILLVAEVIRIDPDRIDHDAIERAGAILRDGGLVAFPTETVYGLGCNALDERAVQRLFEAKGRPSDDPLIVHVARHWPLTRIVAESAAPAVERIARLHWPGPLTIVAPRASAIAPAVTAGLDTVGVRCPAHPVAAALIEAAGVPVAAPSANRFGYISPTSAEHVLDGLGDRCDLVIDGGRTQHGIESTVAALEGSELVVLRHGAVTLETLHASLGDSLRVRAADQSDHDTRSPGRQRRHYSPRTPTIAVRRSALGAAVPGAPANSREVLYLGYDDRRPELPAGWTFRSLGRVADLDRVAFNLYDSLRRHDSAQGNRDWARGDRVILAELTEAPGLGRAIDDRLVRAAGGRVVSTSSELAEALARPGG